MLRVARVEIARCQDLRGSTSAISKHQTNETVVRTTTNYLGFLVNASGLQVDPEKVAPILSYPVPRNIKELRRFVGISSWYRRFIPDYATLSALLTLLLRKRERWRWTGDQFLAFEQIRACLSKASILSCPDFNTPFELQTDASSTGLGAVLSQTVDVVERVVSYASRTLLDAEKNYSTTEKECLAVIWAIQKFRAYLEGYHFTVVTDHSSLRWLHNLKNPTGRLSRWALSLLEYSYDIVHRKGSSHHVPDALSRMFEDPLEIISLAKDPTPSWYVRRFLTVTNYPEKFHTWRISRSDIESSSRPTTGGSPGDAKDLYGSRRGLLLARVLQGRGRVCSWM